MRRPFPGQLNGLASSPHLRKVCEKRQLGKGTTPEPRQCMLCLELSEVLCLPHLLLRGYCIACCRAACCSCSWLSNFHDTCVVGMFPPC